MRLTPGGIRLDDILGGTLNVGTIPAPRFRRFEGQATNGIGLTITAAGVDIITLDCGSVVAGDRFFIQGLVDMVKGLTAGRSSVSLLQHAGTAGIAFGESETAAVESDSGVPASEAARFSPCAMGKVTSSGTLTLKLRGVSAGSDSTVAINNGEIHVWIIPGS